VIDIDSHFVLPDDAVERFNHDGFIRLRSVLSPATIQYYGEEITRLTQTLSTQTLPLEKRSTYDQAFLQVMNLWESSPRVLEFVLSKRLGRIAAELLGVRGVRLYHDQSLYKEPAGGITPAHADQYYWPLASDRTVTAWIPLQAVPLPMGPLGFFAGSQREQFGRELAISDESEQVISRAMQERGFPFIEAPFEIGDLSLHMGWTFHRAGANDTGQGRSVMTIIYMDQDMRLTAPRNDMQRNDWATWCPGAVPGQVIQTARNPLIYTQ